MGAENPVTLCDLGILANQATEHYLNARIRYLRCLAWHHRDLIIATHRQLGAPVISVRSRHSRIPSVCTISR